MNNLYKTTFLTLYLFLGLTIPSCSKIDDISNSVVIDKKSNDLTADSLNKFHDISLTFNVKAAETSKRIRSFDAYLVKDFSDPFKSGVNVFSDGFKVQGDFDGSISDKVTLTFENVPIGGPYYAVIGAYDLPLNDSQRKNITKLDNSILSADKKWARSTNSVNVNSNGLIFSDNDSKFIVKVDLEAFNNIISEVSPQNGSATKGSIKLSL